jgi:predicted transcriptional regulator
MKMDIDEPMAAMLKLIQEAGEKGAEYIDIKEKMTLHSSEFDESLNWLLERGLIYEPILGVFKVV